VKLIPDKAAITLEQDYDTQTLLSATDEKGKTTSLKDGSLKLYPGSYVISARKWGFYPPALRVMVIKAYV
jgi:hypothetical protein